MWDGVRHMGVVSGSCGKSSLRGGRDSNRSLEPRGVSVIVANNWHWPRFSFVSIIVTTRSMRMIRIFDSLRKKTEESSLRYLYRRMTHVNIDHSTELFRCLPTIANYDVQSCRNPFCSWPRIASTASFLVLWASLSILAWPGEAHLNKHSILVG